MPRIRRAFPALLPILIALALGACGSDDNEDSGKSADPGKTKTQTRGAASGGGAQDNPPGQEITSCLGKAGLNVIVSSGSVVDADYRLVVNSGGAGVLYGFADNAKAAAAKGKVDEYEGSSGRTVEVVGDTLFAYFPAGQTLAESEKSDQVRNCAR
jgi:hypothetical protein